MTACVDNAPAYRSNDWINGENERSLRVRGCALLVMTNYTFSCEGVVKQWIVEWDALALYSNLGSCKIVFDFHVLRPTGSCRLTSIGKNRVVVETGIVVKDTTYTSIFNISDSERISVRSGDVVGLAVTHNRTYENRCFLGRFYIAEQDSDRVSLPTNEVHYTTDSFDPDSITEFDLEECSSDNRDDDEDFTSRRTRFKRDNFEVTDFRVYYATPLINAVVGKHLLW